MIGVIADDLSGAAEIGAIGLRFGLSARILCGEHRAKEWRLDVPNLNAIETGSRTKCSIQRPGLICVDTDSRLCSETEARRRAALAAKRLERAGVKWIYKKIDSVLRGHVVAEIDSIMRELKLRCAVVIPANPSRGRIVRGSQYWIGDRLIHQTEFARDPEYPRWTSDVLKLVSRKEGKPIFESLLLLTSAATLPRTGIVIGESANTGALKRWAQLARRKLLLAGAAEFFVALLMERGFKKTRRAADLDLDRGRELFVCGTMSEASALFVQRSRVSGVPVFSLPTRLARQPGFSAASAGTLAVRVSNAFRRHTRVILTIGLPQIKNPRIAKSLTIHLVSVAENVIRSGGVERIYAEGGATATALVSRMGWTRMDVLEELAPGVATLAVGADQNLRLTIKPGSYVWPEEIVGELKR